jgi:hypothetical protein
MEFSPRAGSTATEQERLREIEGAERVALLPLAHSIAVSPGTEGDEPAYVFIEWSPSNVERPFPGTAIWRAALEGYLEHGASTDEHPLVRQALERSLSRFPTVSSWLRWADGERERRQDRGSRGSVIGAPLTPWPW